MNKIKIGCIIKASQPYFIDIEGYDTFISVHLNIPFIVLDILLMGNNVCTLKALTTDGLIGIVTMDLQIMEIVS